MLSGYASRKEYDKTRYQESPTGIAAKEKKRLKDIDKFASGVAPEDLVLYKNISLKDYDSRKEYDAISQVVRYAADAPAMTVRYAANVSAVAAQYAADKDTNDALYRAAQMTAGVSAEELGPSYEEIKKEVDNRFEWGHGWVKITDFYGKVWFFEGLR